MSDGFYHPTKLYTDSAARGKDSHKSIINYFIMWDMCVESGDILLIPKVVM